MQLVRTLFALVLSLALAFGALAAGFVRGQPMAVGQMVICAGGEERVVTVDAEGKPVAHVHCPDCLAGGATGLAPEQALPDPDLTLAGLAHLPIRAIPAPQPPCLAAHARGPPVLA